MIRHKLRFLCFCLYNLAYVLYVVGKLDIKYYWLSLGIFCILNAVVLVRNCRQKHRSLSSMYGKRELKLGISFTVVLFGISLLIQTIHNDFSFSYLLSDIAKFLFPIANAFLIVNTFDNKEQDLMFDILLTRFVLNFILINVGKISLSNILAVSWANSSSSMESSLAHDFIILEMYYLMKKKTKKAIICVILCMLSMKRISFIIAPLLLLFSKKINSNEGAISNQITILVKVLAIISPFVLLLLYSNNFQSWLYETLGFDLNRFVSGRFTIYQTITNNISSYNGLGSINALLSSFVTTKYGTSWNAVFHNDLLRILLETTVIGLTVLTNNLVEIGKKSKWTFMAICYLLLVATTSHIFNYSSVWIMFYMMSMANGKLMQPENTK